MSLMQRAREAEANRRPTITLGADEHRVVDEAAEAIADDPDVYQKDGLLVRVVTDAEDDDDKHKIAFNAGVRIVPMSAATIRERLTGCADWLKIVEKKEEGATAVRTVPTRPIVDALRDRGDWQCVRRLVAVVESPVMLPNGTILTEPGYHERTGLMLAPRSPVAVSVPDAPTLGDARNAADALLDVVRDFPFAADHHRAAWLASLLTVLSRFRFRGCAPLFLVEGNTPGCGKGLLADVTSLIATGGKMAVTTLPSDGDEFRKRITAVLLRGSPMVLFDNVSGQMGGPELDAMLTSSVWSDRVLGESRTVEMPVWSTFFATANNIAVKGDTMRRVCPIRLESRHERPEERTDFQRADLRAWVTAERPRLLSAALTILRAYHVAGCPDMKLPPWGSFEPWSALVRGAVVWVGLADPFAGRTEMRESRGDDKLQAFAELLKLWSRIDPTGNGVTCAQIVKHVDEAGDEELAEVMLALVGAKNAEKDRRASSLGYIIRQNDGRFFGGKRVVHAGGRAGVKRWSIDGGDDGDGCDTSNPRTEGKSNSRVISGWNNPNRHNHPHHENGDAPTGNEVVDLLANLRH